MADVKVSGLPVDSSLDGNHYTILNDPTGPTTKRTLLSTLAAFFFNQVNIPAGNGSPVTRDDDQHVDFVLSGLVWSGDAYASTRNASMTSGVCYINGRKLTISAVTARAFTASKDTYIDILDNLDGTATIVYTEVTNNAASPSLAANSLRIGIVVTGASNIASAASINQGDPAATLPVASSSIYSVTDSLGNMICPMSPSSTRQIGYRQITSNTTCGTSDADVTGLHAMTFKLERASTVEFDFYSPFLTGNNTGAVLIEKITDNSNNVKQQVNAQDYGAQGGGPAECKVKLKLAAGSYTYKARGAIALAGTTETFNASSTQPNYFSATIVG